LHSMNDPLSALQKAFQCAREVLIMEHLCGSPWSWYANENQGVQKAWDAIQSCGVRRKADYQAVQLFKSGAELFRFFENCDSIAHQRIREFENAEEIKIEMPYGFAVI
jgi:hypothetical protein